MDDKQELLLEVYYNDKVYSAWLDGYRIGGCKYSDVVRGKEVSVHVNIEDILHVLHRYSKEELKG